MKTVETIILILMTFGLGAGGFLLWNKRTETGDYSRHVQAMLNWMSAFLSIVFLVRIWIVNPAPNNEILEADMIFFPSLLRLLFLIYPLEVIKHGVSRMIIYPLIYSPVVALLIIGQFSGIDFTPICSFQHMLQNVGKLDVLFRIFSLVVLFLYSFVLFFLPRNFRKCATDKCFIPRFVLFFCLMGVAYSITLIMDWKLVGFVHQVLWMTLFFSITYWELKERLVVNEAEESVCSTEDEAAQSEGAAEITEPEQAPVNDELWEKILHVMNELEGWRNPEMSLNSLSEQVLSNRTYVGDAFKRNTGMTFSEYVSKRRIDDVVAVLTRNPEAQIQEAFLNAGYRQRSTAWKNFHKIMGVSPTEFVENCR